MVCSVNIFDEHGNKKTGDVDSLALFITIEIIETFTETLSKDEQIDEAVHVLKRGISDLEDAIRGLEELKG
jgi:hypothetical protein